MGQALATLLLVTLSAIGAVAQPFEGRLKIVHDTATLRIAYRTDSRPFSFLDAQGQPTGYTIELCKRISKSLEGELAWNPAAVRSLLPTLAWSGKAVHFVSSSRSREDAAGLEGASRLSGSCHLIGRDGVAARTVTAHQLTES